MKNILSCFVIFFLGTSLHIFGQAAKITRSQFFSDSSIINATITTNLIDLFRQKGKEGTQYAANFSTVLPDGTPVNEPVLLELRGHFRKGYCYIPPIRIIFKSKIKSALSPLGTLKLVSECKPSSTGDQYLLKEFLVYKIYNRLTEKSFRVRLLNLNLVDTVNKKKSLTEHAFLVEDIKDVAKRSNCVEWKNIKLSTEASDRRQMTIVAIFEFMIGNTDWSVPANHNTRLIRSQTDSFQRPFVVPYDFDYSGLVNTDYAVPDEKLELANVRERMYRGFSRTMAELNDVLDIFKKQKDDIYTMIKNFDLLTPSNRKDMHDYLDQFFFIIASQQEINSNFIQGARTE